MHLHFAKREKKKIEDGRLPTSSEHTQSCVCAIQPVIIFSRASSFSYSFLESKLVLVYFSSSLEYIYPSRRSWLVRWKMECIMCEWQMTSVAFSLLSIHFPFFKKTRKKASKKNKLVSLQFFFFMRTHWALLELLFSTSSLIWSFPQL